VRVYAIGDIHGRIDLLTGLFEKIDASIKSSPVEQPVHVLLGDYIDRGPNPRHVIDALIQRHRTHWLICLKGNHESYADQVLRDPDTLAEWMQAGGVSTLLSYGVKPSTRAEPRTDEETVRAFSQAMPQSHRLFIQSLALSFTCGDYFFTHAGVRPGIPLNVQREHDLLWIRDDFLLHEEGFEKIIVHGHTPTKEPDIRSNRINIDTGAYATGRLTCLVLEDEKVAII
jgi:serine/threonine protein phosphatase 1